MKRGHPQGNAPSPFIFNSSVMQPYLAWCSAEGKGWRLPSTKGVDMSSFPSDPASAFLDDISHVTEGSQALLDMQSIVDITEL